MKAKMTNKTALITGALRGLEWQPQNCLPKTE